MSFPTTSVLDNFNRSESPLSTGWAGNIWEGESGTLAANGSTCWETNSFGWGSAYRNSETFGNSEAYFTLTTLDTNGILSLYVRMSTPGTDATFDGYYLHYNCNANTLKLFRIDNGVETQLGSTVTGFSMVATNKLGLEANGSVITGYKYSSGAWASVITSSDDTYSTGYIGLRVQADGSRMDDFGGGTIGAAPETTAARLACVRALLGVGL